MRTLTIGATLNLNLETLDESVGEYEAQDLVDIIRIQLQEAFYQYDLEVEIYDFAIEEDDW